MKELETAAPDDRLTGKTHEELTLILVEMVRAIVFMYCRLSGVARGGHGPKPMKQFMMGGTDD